MIHNAFRFRAFLLCYAFLTAAIALHSMSAEKPKAIPADALDRSVIAALSHQGVTKPKVISHIDLTEPFGTATQWTFVAVQDRGQPVPDSDEDGPIFLCFVKAASPDCTQNLYQRADDLPYHLFADRVVYANPNQATPLLFLNACGAVSANGNCGIATALYRYDKGTDRFTRAFLNLTGRNNNQATRFVESGPLQGDLIVDEPTENAPYTYWISVYRTEGSGQYQRILRYRSRTGYSDGNPLTVADSEMAEILRRLGLWKPGDPLPVPVQLPKGCSRLFMRDGEEWCR